MWDSIIFDSLFETSTTTSIAAGQFVFCVLAALALGLLIAWLYSYKTKCTKSFLTTLTILPAVVAVVIMMVNGNIGAGVAVAGAFSLVRFRSVPGTAKEIGAIFLAMGAGLAIGMGYVGLAVLFVVIVSGANFLLTLSPFGDEDAQTRVLVITIPESLDYTGVFDDVFALYTSKSTLERVKTTNMGSLLKLTYDVSLLKEANEKAFLDDLRCRNGNLEIVLAKHVSAGMEL